MGLLAELYSPNFVTGILGALMVLLGLIGLGTLPLNVGGLLLIVFGMVLFGLELTVTSHGLLGFGGLVCFALGASALFTGPVDPFQPLVRVALPDDHRHDRDRRRVPRADRLRRRSGRAGSVAGRWARGCTSRSERLGEVRSPLSPLGSVIAAGEEWSARSADGQPLERGTHVRVVKVEGLTLTVEPDASSSTGT